VALDERPVATPVPSTAAAHTSTRGGLQLDTGAIEQVLRDLEPVDHTTSFAHEPTAQLPMLRPDTAVPTTTPVVQGGKRRAATRTALRTPKSRTTFLRRLPSAPVLLGIAALAVSAGGAVKAGGPEVVAAHSETGPSAAHAATALNGSSATVRVGDRSAAVTRSSDDRASAAAAAGDQQQKAAAEGLAAERGAALTKLDGAADEQSKVIAQNLWTYPLEPVVLTARFGQYGLWASYHTGLDFNGNTGDQIHAIANGTVISASYDGSYGNKTVVQLEDGTEIWYCHQSAFMVSVGDTVRSGEVIGLVGATGHVTGSHLHVEVRPGGGDPVDPYAAMQEHGLFRD
jgi:murein DD-endopeptidase MepM/ murein hydrolase activator NlpD